MTFRDEHSIDKAEIVRRSNALRRVLTSDFRQVEKLVEDHDVVFAVFQEATSRDGVGTTIVKGRRLLMEIVAGGDPKELSWTAIPCTCLEQAIALKQVCGEPELN